MSVVAVVEAQKEVNRHLEKFDISVTPTDRKTAGQNAIHAAEALISLLKIYTR